MPVIGLTGGIATGKSTFAPLLIGRFPEMAHFDSDRCVHELLAEDVLIATQISGAFGSDALGEDGRPSRKKLREIVFSDEDRRKRLESILHPAVRQRWMAEASEARRRNAWLLIDIPL